MIGGGHNSHSCRWPVPLFICELFNDAVSGSGYIPSAFFCWIQFVRDIFISQLNVFSVKIEPYHIICKYCQSKYDLRFSRRWHEDGGLLGCSAVYTGMSVPTFQRSVLPPSSGHCGGSCSPCFSDSLLLLILLLAVFLHLYSKPILKFLSST
jgi:hypothetical protein